jgi:hypothetical protein
MRIVLVVVLAITLTLGAPVLAHAYEPKPPSKGTVEGTEQQAKEAAERQAKEDGEKKQKEEAEHQATEAHQHEEAEHQRAEALNKEAEEQAAKRNAEVCVVPNLKGYSLTRARTALHKAHCALGKVVTPHGSHGHLVVVGQNVKRGLKRPLGTAVAVTLGAAKTR